MEFTWNKEKKKFVAPNGEIMTGPQVLNTLNNMLGVLTLYDEAFNYIDNIIQSTYTIMSGEDADADSDTGQVVNEEAVGSEVQPSE